MAVYKHHFLAHRDRHAEYLVRSGRLCINRLVEAPSVNAFIESKCSNPVPQPQEYGEAKTERALMLSTSSPGRLDKLHFVDWPEYSAPLPDDQIEVEIKATGLNFRDVMVAMGEVAAATFGHEGAGIVTKVGAGVTDVKPGDRMLVLSALHGTFQTHTRTPREIAAKIPDDMSFETAAGMPVIFSTAYYCLAEVARLRAGETCLIHAAAGGVGQAAIQIAQNMGAEVFATVSSPEKRQLLMDEYGVPADHIFSSRDLSFAEGVMRMTNNRGVDVILNSLAGEALRASWDCIATFGRFIEIGKRDIFANGRLDMLPFSRSVMFAACDLYTITKLDTKTTHRILNEIISMWQSGAIRAAKPNTVYSLSQIEEAFRLLQAGKHMGKVVLTAGEKDVVKVIPQPPAPTKFKPDATYILSGGLGGLGRSIARWMAKQGARNLVFFSRSGGAGEAAKELLQDLGSSGVRAAAVACDVSDEQALVTALKTCEADGFPKVAGVVQGAMQLKVVYCTHRIRNTPTDRIRRTLPSNSCRTTTTPPASLPKSLGPGTSTNTCQRTWTSSSCCLPSAASSATAASPTTPPATPIRTRSRRTAARATCPHRRSISATSSASGTSPRTRRRSTPTRCSSSRTTACARTSSSPSSSSTSTSSAGSPPKGRSPSASRRLQTSAAAACRSRLS
ncbi:Beta-ketoacyl synthase [Macrophomina phaseolina MS6]|uniref:Beta-ketoacyl synthase n=1 Tax=Macrophomina phaseolina (strain MS6) TaxID=1126212 RepID=K2SEC5_MACPH|nr:Beta-ketoacyl synthase [Macrophomina phaseolina MS6]